MSLSPRRVTDDYAVLGQLQPQDLATAKSLGFRSIINNRPDGEEPGQPEACTLAKAAMELGLDYVHIPVTGPITASQQHAMREALSNLPQPVLAFCRSGARSTRIWAHAMQNTRDTDDILQAAGKAGCDVTALADELNTNKENTHE